MNKPVQRASHDVGTNSGSRNATRKAHDDLASFWNPENYTADRYENREPLVLISLGVGQECHGR